MGGSNGRKDALGGFVVLQAREVRWLWRWEAKGTGRGAWKPEDRGMWTLAAGLTAALSRGGGGNTRVLPCLPQIFSYSLSGFGVSITLASKTSWEVLSLIF